jgi:hypothetical protein
MAQYLIRHVEEEMLERYCMHRTGEEEAAQIEEHLLVCDRCRQRVDETGTFVRAMKTGAGQSRDLPASAGGRWRSWFAVPPRVAWAFAGTGAVVAGLFLMRVVPGRDSGAVAAVVLQSTRGESTPGQVPANRPMRLQPDLSGLPPFDTYVLQMVNASGATIWEGNFHPGAGALVAGQKAGSYFVRLYSPSRQLLREYPVRLNP